MCVSLRQVWSSPVVGEDGWDLGLQVEAFSCGELVGLWSVGLVCLKGTGWRSGDPACLEIVQACAGVRGTAQLRSWRPVQA
jgi:hypothetical protein